MQCRLQRKKMETCKKTRYMIPALIAICVTIAILAVPIHSKSDVSTRGWWETYTYTRSIPKGTGIVHYHIHESALSAYAYLVSSTGEADLDFEWEAPVLMVVIRNLDDKKITVTWRERFYVN